VGFCGFLERNLTLRIGAFSIFALSLPTIVSKLNLAEIVRYIYQTNECNALDPEAEFFQYCRLAKLNFRRLASDFGLAEFFFGGGG
jgi:hypothetical protein